MPQHSMVVLENGLYCIHLASLQLLHPHHLRSPRLHHQPLQKAQLPYLRLAHLPAEQVAQLRLLPHAHPPPLLQQLPLQLQCPPLLLLLLASLSHQLELSCEALWTLEARHDSH